MKIHEVAGDLHRWCEVSRKAWPDGDFISRTSGAFVERFRKSTRRYPTSAGTVEDWWPTIDDIKADDWFVCSAPKPPDPSP